MRFILKCSFRAVFILVFLFNCGAIARAQSADWTKVLSSLPSYERLEGTITVQGYQSDIGLGGGSAVAKVWFQKPNSLRIEMQPDETTGVRGLIVVAHDKTTRIYDPISHRLRELPYNVVDEWWRGWSILNGGPANALFAGFSPAQLPQYYNITAGADGKLLEMKAVDAKSILQPDFVRVGGSGDAIFYAPYLEKAWEYAPLAQWKFDANGMPSQREEGAPSKVLYRSTITIDTTSHLPVSAKSVDFDGRFVANFTYDLKQAKQPFDESTFTISAADGQIAEAAKVLSPADYRGNDAATLFNKGVALATGEEDYAGAYAAWQAASAAAPKAVAPWFALYQSALLTHDLNRAQNALDGLSQILGADNEDVLTRKASLAISTLRWDEAETALAALIKVHPQNATYLLAQANLERSRGKTGAERGALGQILAMPDAPRGVQAGAALNWSLNALTGVDRTAQDIDQKTPAQNLVKQMVASINGAAKADESTFDDAPSLLMALALVQEELGQRTEAIATWTKVAAIFPFPLDNTARWHLMALAAQNDDEDAAMAQYQRLRETAFGRDAVRRLQEEVINVWQKAFGQDKLEALLKRRALAMKANADDAELWLAFQSTFGSQEDMDAAIKNGVVRFSSDAWWQSRRAELLSSWVSSSDFSGTMSADEALGAAVEATNKAIALDPTQPYYYIQKALILRTIAMPSSPIINSQSLQPKQNAAETAFAQLAKKWPNNSDVQLAAAIGHLPLDTSSQRSATLQSIDKTVHEAQPLQSTYLDETSALGGNHMRAFAALQAKASIARRQNDFSAVTQYYQELLISSRNADEEQGVAINYLRQAIAAKSVPSITALLTRLAHEPWKWDGISSMFNAAGSILALNPPQALEIIGNLQKSSDPYARWGAARLSATLVASLSLAMQNPNAPDEMQTQQDTATKSLAAALTSLTSSVDGEDKILAARAAAALGESALERATQREGDDDAEADRAAKAAVEWYEKVVAIDPSESAFGRDFVTTLSAAGDAEGAKNAALSLLAKLTLDPDAMRQAARRISLTATDDVSRKRAAILATSAFLLAQNSTSSPVPIFWKSGIIAARCLMAAGNIDEAQKIYQRLSLPQWEDNDRAVAYLDWQYQLKKAGRDSDATNVQQMLEDLDLNNPQMKSVEWMWHTLD